MALGFLTAPDKSGKLVNFGIAWYLCCEYQLYVLLGFLNVSYGASWRYFLKYIGTYMKKSLLALIISSVVVATGCSSTDSTEEGPGTGISPEMKEKVIAAVESYKADPNYGQDVIENPIRDTEVIDAVKTVLETADWGYINEKPEGTPSHPIEGDIDNPTLGFWIDKTRDQDGVGIYGIYINGIHVGEIHWQDGAGDIYRGETQVGSIDPVGEGQHAYMIRMDGATGDYVIINSPKDGVKAISVDEIKDRIDARDINKQQLKAKARAAKERVKDLRG